MKLTENIKNVTGKLDYMLTQIFKSLATAGITLHSYCLLPSWSLKMTFYVIIVTVDDLKPSKYYSKRLPAYI